jgi:hypothetical protein
VQTSSFRTPIKQSLATPKNPVKNAKMAVLNIATHHRRTLFPGYPKKSKNILQPPKSRHFPGNGAPEFARPARFRNANRRFLAPCVTESRSFLSDPGRSHCRPVTLLSGSIWRERPHHATDRLSCHFAIPVAVMQAKSWPRSVMMQMNFPDTPAIKS